MSHENSRVNVNADAIRVAYPLNVRSITKQGSIFEICVIEPIPRPVLTSVVPINKIT